jgi:acetoin utilization protein AcuB
MITAFGARHSGIRITINFSEKPGQLARFAGAIAEKGGNIVAFVSAEGDDMAHRRATLKITGISRADVEAAAMTISGAEIEDIRE